MIQSLLVILAISGPDADAVSSLKRGPTWAEPIRAIMQQHCVSCHQAGGAAGAQIGVALRDGESHGAGVVLHEDRLAKALAEA